MVLLVLLAWLVSRFALRWLLLRVNSICSNSQAVSQAFQRVVWRVCRPLAWAVVSLAVWPVHAAARADGPLLTIVEGAARVFTRTEVQAAAAGVEVAPASLIETAADARLVRIEWPDGSALDLGPQTRVMLEPDGLRPRNQPRPMIYLLAGWVKLSAGPKAPTPGLISPAAEISPFSGVLVVHATEASHWVFAETGAATLTERPGKLRHSLKPGQAHLRKGDAKGAVQQRPSGEELKAVPRGFRDTLPTLYENFAAKPKAAKPLPDPLYEEMLPWLQSESSLRRSLPNLFSGWARVPDMRKGIDQNLSRHAEWEFVLYPNRVEVKPGAARLKPSTGS